MWLGKGREIIKPLGSKTEKEPYEKYLIVFTDIAANYAKQLLNDVELKEECTYVRRAFVGEYKEEKIYVLNPYFGSLASVFALEIAIFSQIFVHFNFHLQKTNKSKDNTEYGDIHG